MVFVTAPIGRRTNGARCKTTTSVWAYILDYIPNARGAQRAFEAAYNGLGRIGRKELPAVLQIGRISNNLAGFSSLTSKTA
jgi:hypothetical protein